MLSNKTYILDDLPTEHDALDFTPYVETLVNVCKTTCTLTMACSAHGAQERSNNKYRGFRL